MYGLFHLVSPVLMDAVLLYNLREHGMDLTSIGLLGWGALQIGLVCAFGQYIEHAVIQEIHRLICF